MNTIYSTPLLQASTSTGKKKFWQGHVCTDGANYFTYTTYCQTIGKTIVDIQTASLYKYMMNSYLATKVTFMNDFKLLADAEGVVWNDLKYLSTADSRIGNTHMDVPGPDGQYGWGGGCFPKDIAAIIMEAIDKNVDFELLDRVETINKKHRKL